MVEVSRVRKYFASGLLTVFYFGIISNIELPKIGDSCFYFEFCQRQIQQNCRINFGLISFSGINDQDHHDHLGVTIFNLIGFVEGFYCIC